MADQEYLDTISKKSKSKSKSRSKTRRKKPKTGSKFKKKKKKKKTKKQKKMSEAELKQMEDAMKEAEAKEQAKQEEEERYAQEVRSRKAVAHHYEYRQRVKAAYAQRRWRTLKTKYQVSQFETHKRVLERAFVCVKESEARWNAGNQQGAVALLTQYAEKYRKTYPELDCVLKKAHGRSVKMRYTMLELCLINMLETDEEKQDATKLGKQVPTVLRPSACSVKHQKYVEVAPHDGPVDVLRREEFTLHVVDHHNELVKMRQKLMEHAGDEVEDLWSEHEKMRQNCSQRRSSVQLATEAVQIQDALFSHTDKLIAWHDDYTNNRERMQKEMEHCYNLYKKQVDNVNSQYQSAERFGPVRGALGKHSFTTTTQA